MGTEELKGEPAGLEAEGGGSSWMKERSGRQQSQERDYCTSAS